jgi:hypothetical protein
VSDRLHAPLSSAAAAVMGLNVGEVHQHRLSLPLVEQRKRIRIFHQP